MLMMYAYFMGTARSKVLMVSMISGRFGQHRGRRLAHRWSMVHGSAGGCLGELFCRVHWSIRFAVGDHQDP